MTHGRIHDQPRIPLSLDDALVRMRLADRLRSPEQLIGDARHQPVVVQEFRPLTESLEWQLSRLHWQTAGTLPFADNEVPFMINNTGRLSEDAAALLFHNCVEAPPEGDFAVLEPGAGSGLFARYFLDFFRALCVQEGKDFFSHLRYIASDASATTVSDWHSRGMFAPYPDTVCPVVCNADDPGSLARTLAPVIPSGSGLRAVFCNYVLDVLSSKVIRRNRDAVEELQVRTHLINDAGLLQQYTDLTAPEIQKIALEEDADEYRRLLPLASLFDVEAAFKPLNNSGERQYLEGALTHAADTEQVLVNTGAIDFLLELRTLMHDCGFVLINDYGPTSPEQSFAYSATQRFGRTTAQGLNFPLLDTILSLNSWSVETPAADAERSIHSRLLVRSELPLTFECFQNRFSADAQSLFETPLAEARDHSNAGRKGQALECYRTAVARSPRDWRVLGEAAEFVGLELKDFGSGIQLAQAAVELNPWYSSWLWNVLGDCLFCAGRYTDAHEAYLQAQRVSPTDPRTNLNLSYTWLHLGDFEEALRAIGTGLAGDAGAYRPRMMEKQVAILATMDAQRAGEQDRFMRRAGRLLVRKDPASATAHPAT